MIALAEPLGMSADEILCDLPMAQGNQYLCALAIRQGAHPVWSDEHQSREQMFERVRTLLRASLERRRDV